MIKSRQQGLSYLRQQAVDYYDIKLNKKAIMADSEYNIMVLKVVNKAVISDLLFKERITQDVYQRLYDMLDSSDDENVILADKIIDQYYDHQINTDGTIPENR